MDISRLHRVLKIITLLQTRHRYGPAELARELEVSRRTIYRDLNMLELAGIPFYYDRQTRSYEIHQTYWLPPINLSLEEALSLVALADRTADGREPLPMFDSAVDAARKIESRLPLAIRAAVGQVADHMSIRRTPSARHDALGPVYQTARKAVAERRTVGGRYISFAERKQIRVELDPYWLVFHERAWYLIGHSHGHGAIRTFKLGRFVEMEPTGDRFKRPSQTVDQYLGNAWRFIPEGREYAVRLRFLPRVAANVAEVRWHATQRVTWEDDGSILFEATVDGLGEISWWILSYGENVEVLEPQELRQRIRQTALRVAERNG